MACKIVSVALPPDLVIWIRGYAVARGVSISRTVADLIVEKRAELKTISKETQAIKSMLRKKRGD